MRQREGKVIGRERKHGGFYQARIRRQPTTESTGFSSGCGGSGGDFSSGGEGRIERGVGNP
jgi:hypothetical protein